MIGRLPALRHDTDDGSHLIVESRPPDRPLSSEHLARRTRELSSNRGKLADSDFAITTQALKGEYTTKADNGVS